MELVRVMSRRAPRVLARDLTAPTLDVALTWLRISCLIPPLTHFTGLGARGFLSGFLNWGVIGEPSVMARVVAVLRETRCTSITAVNLLYDVGRITLLPGPQFFLRRILSKSLSPDT